MAPIQCLKPCKYKSSILTYWYNTVCSSAYHCRKECFWFTLAFLSAQTSPFSSDLSHQKDISVHRAPANNVHYFFLAPFGVKSFCVNTHSILCGENESVVWKNGRSAVSEILNPGINNRATVYGTFTPWCFSVVSNCPWPSVHVFPINWPVSVCN